jgi:multiple antibiotic resistance protein
LSLGGDLFSTLWLAGQLYAILNPISVIPTYLSLTDSLDGATRLRLLTRATYVVLGLLVFFSLLGFSLLGFFGIDVNSIRVGGGILLMVIGIDMLGDVSQTRRMDPHEVMVVPIASPLLVGPGTLTLLLVSAERYPTPLLLASSLIATLGVHFTLRYCHHLTRFLGRNGVRAMGRLMSLIIMAVAAEMIHAALLAWGIARA